mgnify:CR=1 FL=1
MVLCKYKVAPFNNYRHALRRNRGVQTWRSKMYKFHQLDQFGNLHFGWTQAEANRKAAKANNSYWQLTWWYIEGIEEFC